jgi:hypothetical protein
MPTVARPEAIEDFFSVPLGTVPVDEPEESFGIGPVPAEAAQYPGKWLALNLGEIIAVRDTQTELRREFGHRLKEVTFFHVPSTPNVLR